MAAVTKVVSSDTTLTAADFGKIILMDTTDSVTAARHIQRLIATGHGPVITIADDVNSSYIEGVSACGTIVHS